MRHYRHDQQAVVPERIAIISHGSETLAESQHRLVCLPLSFFFFPAGVSPIMSLKTLFLTEQVYTLCTFVTLYSSTPVIKVYCT